MGLDAGKGAQKSLVPLHVWWLVVATQDGSQLLVLLGRPPGCFLVASGARSWVTMLLEAWGDCECSGDFNTMAMKGRMDFLKKKLTHL